MMDDEVRAARVEAEKARSRSRFPHVWEFIEKAEQTGNARKKESLLKQALRRLREYEDDEERAGLAGLINSMQQSIVIDRQQRRIDKRKG